MEEEKRKKRALDAGREMLEKYKAERTNRRLYKSLDQVSDEESIRNEAETRSMELRNIGIHEGISSRDMTYSSVSMSEGEGEGDFDTIAGRVAELEDVLKGKEAVIEALHAEVNHMQNDISSPNSSLSQTSTIPYKDLIMTYHTKLQEFEQAVNQRDNLIEDLTTSLQQALSSRDVLLGQLNTVNLQLENISSKTVYDEKVTNLEKSLTEQKNLTTILSSQLTETQAEVQKLELVKESQNNEICDYKQQIERLNEKISSSSTEVNAETFELRKQYENHIEKIKRDMKVILEKFQSETDGNSLRHKNEIKELVTKHEVELKKLKEENKNLESVHAKELLTFQSQLRNYKSTVEALKQELVRSTENQDKAIELLGEQVKLHKIQLEETTAKYMAAATVLDSKESIERSLEQALNNAAALKQENDSLKFKLDDLSSRYTAAQCLIENNQEHERTLSCRINNLEKSLSRLSGISFSELDATTYQNFDEVSLQYHMTRQKLEEKAEIEKQLADKVEDLERNVEKTKDELENANLAKESYEKQIKDLKNICDRLKQEMDKSDNSNLRVQLEQEIDELKQTLKDRDAEIAEYLKNIEDISKVQKKFRDENEKLKSGLETAWAQCAEFEGKLDQTLGLSETRTDEVTLEQTQSSYTEMEELFKHADYNKILQKLDSCCIQLEKCEKEKQQLVVDLESRNKKIEELTKEIEQFQEQHKEEIEVLKLESAAEATKLRGLLISFEEGNCGLAQLRGEMESRHAQEVEELRKYFEQKCLQMEKQYSDEIFSLHSKKMSDNDSEIEELTDDLYMGGGGDLGGAGDCLGISVSLDNENEAQLSSSDFKNKGTDEEVAKMVAEYEDKIENLRRQVQEVKDRANRSNISKQSNQTLLSAESDLEEDWPSELLEIRNKFTNNAKREIYDLKERHATDIRQMKETNTRIIERLEEEIKKIRQETQESIQNNLIKERDTLHKTCSTLRALVGQLVEYFTLCEDEVNNTLICEVLKSLSQTKEEGNASIDEVPCEEEPKKVKRVHFAPQSNEITTIINGDDTSIQNLIDTDQDIEELFKAELDACLRRLKSDSAHVLGISQESENWSTPISRNGEIFEAQEPVDVEEENKHLKEKLREMQKQLLLVENKKEIITEGYGEQDESNCETLSQDYLLVQDKARSVIMNGSNDASYLLQLIEELCRHTDRSMDDVRKEKEDLQHQIEAADKQLKSTRKFMEEQASEREAERDEAAKQIDILQEKLREREREKDRDQRISSESSLSPAPSFVGSLAHRPYENIMSVEALETQMREMSSLVSDTEARKSETESYLKEAIEKIGILRSIISDFEVQLEAKTEKETELQRQIEQRDDIILAQTKNQQELVQELDAIKSGSEHVQLNEHITHLQEELRKHQLSTEHLTAKSSALKQMKTELKELQIQLDKKTKELESLHICGSNLSLSQPSEDVSIREQIDAARCPTPDDPTSPPIFPLDRILKLKETLWKHFRAEDVALKRLKDLDIQLVGLQRQNEDLHAEQEILQQTTSEQLLQIETLRGRLEHQKQNAPFAQRQATSKLETQLYDLHERMKNSERALADKELELNEAKHQLERVNRILKDKETEITKVVENENDTIEKLKNTLQIIEEEKNLLQGQLGVQERAHQDIPHLIDSMLADKNDEIDHLKEQIAKKDKQLEIFLSLNLDETQLKELAKQNEPKNSARTLSDILSINSECEELYEAIREAPNFTKSENISNVKFANSSTVTVSKRENVESPIPLIDTPVIPRLELGSRSHSSEEETSNAVEITKDYSYDLKNPVSLAPVSPFAQGDRVSELEAQLIAFKEELTKKSIALEQREAELRDIKRTVEELQVSLETMKRDRLFYKSQFEVSQSTERKIQKDLEQVENELKLRNEKLEEYRNKIEVNEKILTEVAEVSKRKEGSLQEKLEEMKNMREIIMEKDTTIETIKTRNMEIEKENKQLYEFKKKFETCHKQFLECRAEIQRLQEGMNNRDEMIRRLEEMARRSSFSGASSPSDKDQEIHHLQEYLKEKDKVIREMNDDSKSLHRALETIQNKMKESGNVLELRRKLKEERRVTTELTEQVARLKGEIELLGESRRIDEETGIEEMILRELNLSARLDEQLLSAIDSDDNAFDEVDETRADGRKDARRDNREILELSTLKDDLEIDREMLRSQVAEYEHRILQLKTALEEECKRAAELSDELSKEKFAVRSIQIQIQREKKIANDTKIKNVELLTQLRLQLSTTLVTNERLSDEVRTLRQEHKNLQLYVDTMKEQNKEKVSFFTELENEQKKLAEFIEKFEKEQIVNKELQERIRRLEAEKDRLEKRLELGEDEHEKLLSSLALAECNKQQLEADLRWAKEEVKTKTDECQLHQTIIKTMNDAEMKRKQFKSGDQNELKDLRRDLIESRQVALNLEEDMKEVKEHCAEFEKRETQLINFIDTLKDEKLELARLLSNAQEEATRLKDAIATLENRQTLQRRGSESQYSSEEKEFRDNVEKENSRLRERLTQYSDENHKLLAQVKKINAQQHSTDHNLNVQRRDLIEKLQHFYRLYLRAESRRKALLYQRIYLLCVISGYQLVEENTIVFLSQLTNLQRGIARSGPHRRNAKVRFRSIVLVIISIHRMKWLVIRWRTGKRLGINAVSEDIDVADGRNRRPFLPNPSSASRSASNVPAVLHYNDEQHHRLRTRRCSGTESR